MNYKVTVTVEHMTHPYRVVKTEVFDSEAAALRYVGAEISGTVGGRRVTREEELTADVFGYYAEFADKMILSAIVDECA